MNRSILSAALIVAGLSAWMLMGVNSQAEENPVESAEPKVAELMKVQVVNSVAKPVQRLVSVQGQVEASQVVQLKSEVDGRVNELAVAEGTRVTAGTELIKLAQDYRPAQLAEAQARLKKAQSDLQANLKLRKRGLQSENQIVADRAELESARAQVAQARYQLQHTVIKAPFNGVLNTRTVELGDFVERGQQVAELVNDEELIVAGQVPQQFVNGLKIGQVINLRLVTGGTLAGELKFISATANADTRSYRVEVALNNIEHQRLIGTSATMQLPVEELTGHWVPGSVLGLGTEGQLQVKALDSENRVELHQAELIRTDKDGFWISGLPYDVTLVSVGQHFVGVGDQVVPVFGNPIEAKEEAAVHANVD